MINVWESLLNCAYRDSVGMVYQFQLIVTHEGQCSETKESVPNIGTVARSIREPSPGAVFLQVLAVEDEFPECLEIDHRLPLNHVARRQNPPRVAHVSEFVGSSIEASLYSLPLA